MKKLLGTTALVAAAFATAPAMAADKIKMKVGGYFVGAIAAVFDADLGAGAGTDERTIRFAREAEVHFKGSTTLDNGVEVGVKFELEGGDDQTATFDNLDEAYIWVEGAFGEFQFGDQDGVGDQMPIVAPSPFLEHFANDTDLDPIGGVFDGGINTVPDFSGDSTKIIYFTPRLAGFQAGLSFAPENSELSGDETYSDAISGDDTYENIFEAGLTWEYGFNGVDLGASFVYVTAEDNGVAVNDVDDWAVGASIGFAGFTVGGAYGEKESASSGNEEYKAWDIGVTYGTGPWTFGVEYAAADRDENNALAGVQEIDDTAIIGGVAYSLGGGANVSLGYKYGEGDANNREGSALFTEFGVKF
ncbi:porin [Pyruvatibacter mobilis]|jgi:predicted porin|uniref:porin n=1 Tax=Pyruvatibacter mobilis TaxID=1712261 RepID=UPI003BAA9BBC